MLSNDFCDDLCPVSVPVTLQRRRGKRGWGEGKEGGEKEEVEGKGGSRRREGGDGKGRGGKGERRD